MVGGAPGLLPRPVLRPLMSFGLLYVLRCQALLCFLLAGFALPAMAWEAELVRVVDGDTIIVTLRNLPVRLYGIDAPEREQAGGAAASAALQALLRPGDVLDVQPRGGLSYGRLVGIVRPGAAPPAETASVNEALLRAGQAWIDRRFCRASFCQGWQEVEKAAQEAGEGLWREAKPVPPWEWRGRKKGRGTKQDN